MDYTQIIIQSIKEANTELETCDITAATTFEELPGFDSMSAVNFQIQLSTHIGDKATEVAPLAEMTIEDYANLLEAL